MTKVKICGVTRPEHALAAADAGADFIGLMFAESHRRIAPSQAREIIAAVRQGSSAALPKFAGVFVNAPVAGVNAIAADLALDLVQLSGDEDEDYLEQMAVPVIKAVRIPPNLPERVAAATAGRTLAALRQAHAIPLLDSHVAGRYGGAGALADWTIAAQLSVSYQILLAGGLTPENVVEAVRTVRPWGVDVSSGVETDKVKDVAKIRSFIAAVRTADAA
ncbi:MAG: phosphoribosylanthranilate isomerase [Dehalococcoidia bacterium]|nr:phosphoribosylanthranilate isomerase [Dehalococcoidia bacterium]